MLAELSIKNFAIIESLSLSFEKGLTVLTGETGAGKSIIIDAISLLVGGRGSSEFVRAGEKRAELEGLFILEEEDHPCLKKCHELGIDASEGMIVLNRNISANGKSICRINGKLVTIGILRDIGSTLVDIHGQHDHQELMDEQKHLHLLDEYGGEEVKKAKDAYVKLYKKYADLTKRLKALSENEQQMAHRLDLLKFQLKEIDDADLKMDEDIKLQEERQEMLNFEKIYEALKNSYESLQGEQRGLDFLRLAMNHLEEAAEFNKQLKEMSETLSNSFYVVEDLTFQLRNELERMEFNPDRLNMIEDRLHVIHRLKRKYGQSIKDILQYRDEIEKEIDTIENRESHIQTLRNELKSVVEELLTASQHLTAIRKKYANKLTAQITSELKQLYMDKTTFKVQFSQKEAQDSALIDGIPAKFGSDGMDFVEFYISTNPGEPLKPLAKIASGGELSRIMLALKTIFSKHQGITSIIFDEVDTGVSGRVAQAIGEKIYQVSINSQVLCITHLPQVAAMADNHLLIAKEVSKEGRTKTKVIPLSEKEKIAEIGRMIAGAEVTELSKQHAKELLDLAISVKSS
ncbi:DNA repair protein RecN [Aeribacillus composti]|uniref:DNA repair protein RecN n=1 Tax=Aeribacillus composti TaxID=1868734 RepID=UPI002E1C5124|nr:DNA repair protein RecN [Aeribacillus composti]MED0746114.1 DNA repair protein RecN [Aeribacillus composti]